MITEAEKRRHKIDIRRELDRRDLEAGVFGKPKPPEPKPESEMTAADRLGRAIGANQRQR